MANVCHFGASLLDFIYIMEAMLNPMENKQEILRERRDVITFLYVEWLILCKFWISFL